MKKKVLAIVLAVAIMTVGVVGGTLAWLQDKTDTVTNVFTTAGINVELNETPNYDSNGDNKPDSWKAQLIPGKVYTKDPVVTVVKNSVDCYLFVKFEEVNSPKIYLEYTSNLEGNGWTKLTGVDGVNDVWYREVTSSTADQSWHLLKDDKITVSGTGVTASNMVAAAKAELKYTAYASQLWNNDTKFTPAQAWENIAK